MESIRNLTEARLDSLRSSIKSRLSRPRFEHTLAVEDEIHRMGELILPGRICELRAAALLHDLTKELSLKEHLEIARRYGIVCSREAQSSSAVLHGFTAAAVIPESFPDFATPDLLSAVRKHTVGAEDMSTFDKLLFLADYIESSRPYPTCISLRRFFWESISSAAPEDRLSVLDAAVFLEIKQTLSHLIEKGSSIAPESLLLYNVYAKGKDLQA